MSHIVKIQSIEQLTHDVRSYKVDKPRGYSFEPGQATELSIQHPAWIDEKRPFSFTSLDTDPYLEFIIKSYHDHAGVTNAFWKLQPGDALLMDDPWGAISYKGAGCFIAGGAGITPFIAIFRNLAKQNQLKENKIFFSNKTVGDVILRDELTNYFGDQARFILTNDLTDHGLVSGYINAGFLSQEIKIFSTPFYICGPEAMTTSISEMLVNLGAAPEALVFER